MSLRHGHVHETDLWLYILISACGISLLSAVAMQLAALEAALDALPQQIQDASSVQERERLQARITVLQSELRRAEEALVPYEVNHDVGRPGYIADGLTLVLAMWLCRRGIAIMQKWVKQVYLLVYQRIMEARWKKRMEKVWKES